MTGETASTNEDGLADQKELAFYASAVEAWIANRMEKDRTILALSTGGLGLLTTLLATVGPTSSRQLGLYVFAGFSFLVTIVCVLIVFEKNADHLMDIIKNDAEPDEGLQWLDRVLFWAFVVGVVITGALAVSAGLSHLEVQP